MKKTLILLLLLLTSYLSSFAQTIMNPLIESRDNWSTTITKIETDKQYTIVSFEYTANSNNSWAQLNKEIFIQNDRDNEHYNYVKSENIAITPAKHTFAKAGDKLTFKVYFKKIPEATKSIDIIERASRRDDGMNFFNFYNVSLTQSYTAGTQTKVKVTDVVLMPPPPISNGNNTNMANEMDNMANAMNAMGPMYATMAKSLMDSRLDYYKQPGKTEELAKVNKQYFDALKKEGFTEDQALRIITTGGILSGAALGGDK